MVMTAAFGVALLAVTALVTDVGYLYLEQARLQTAINAGWKAGFDRMMQIKSAGNPVLDNTQKEAIRQHVRDVIKTNGYTEEDLVGIEIIPENNQLIVRHKKNVGLFFAQIMDIRSSNVAAARADIGDLGTIIPLAIPHGTTKDVSPTKYRFDPFAPDEKFTVGKQYILKLGEKELDPFGGGLAPWGVVPIVATDEKDWGYASNTIYILKQSPSSGGQLAPGNFGCLDLDGVQQGGANDYEDRIKYGYDDPLPEYVRPEGGNMAKPTIRGVQYRIDNDLLDMRIPVVSKYGKGQEQVSIIGFLNFRLVQPATEDKNIPTVYAMYLGADYAVDNTEGLLKVNFGRIDPDNIATNTSQYLDFFKYGYNAPVEYGQMILPENGNATEPTAEALDYRLEDKAETPKKVIVPITEIPEVVKENNPAIATATTIYDLKATDSPGGVIGLASYTFNSSVRVTGFAEFTLLAEDDYERVGDNFDTGDNGDLGPVMPGQVRGTFERYIVEPGKYEMP